MLKNKMKLDEELLENIWGGRPGSVYEFTSKKIDAMFIDGKIHSFIQQPGVGPKTDPTNAAAKEIRSLTDSDISNSQLTISDDGTITRNNQ